MAGLFFCLASTRCRAFILPCCNTAPYNRLQRVLFRKCNYTAHAIKQHAKLYRRFSRNLYRSAAADTRPTQAAIIPSATRWSVSQRRSTSSTYQIQAPRWTLYRPAQPPYYNKVYIRVCSFYGSIPDSAAYHRPCQPGGVSMLPTPGGLQSGTGSAVRAHRVSLAPSTRRGSPAAGTRRAARNHWRLSPQLFSGFRPIANRGQQ